MKAMTTILYPAIVFSDKLYSLCQSSKRGNTIHDVTLIYTQTICIPSTSDILKIVVCHHMYLQQLSCFIFTDSCICATSTSCIMSAVLSNTPPTRWSSCSTSYLNTGLTTTSIGSCLGNVPTMSAGSPICGNGIREGNETCDCGTVQVNGHWKHICSLNFSNAQYVALSLNIIDKILL